MAISRVNERHGKCKSPSYRVWTGMKARCYQRSHNRYHLYGGRGIVVCDRWLHSFSNFISDMGERPSYKHSIDRIDNNGNYEPENCRWATASEQTLKRDKYKIAFNGKMLNPCEIDRELNLPKGMTSWRKSKGWTLDEIADSNRLLPSRVVDRTGNRYGELTVACFEGIKNRYAWWKCICSCGEVVSIRGDQLASGIKKCCSWKNHR